MHGVEGLTYVWTPAQLLDVLGAQDGAWAGSLLRVTPQGTFEHGTLDAAARPRRLARPCGGASAGSRCAARLLAARARRPQPARDDKVVAAWNGLAIAALAETGALLERPDLVEAAAGAPTCCSPSTSRPDACGPGASGEGAAAPGRAGTASAGAPAGVLEDYADVAEGLLALHAVTGEPAWLEVAGGLLDTVLDAVLRRATAASTTRRTTRPTPALIAVRRPQDPTDNAYPSGWSAACGALLSYAALTGSERHRTAAEQGLAVAAASGARVAARLRLGAGRRRGARRRPARGRGGRARTATSGRAALHAVALAGAAPGRWSSRRGSRARRRAAARGPAAGRGPARRPTSAGPSSARHP